MLQILLPPPNHTGWFVDRYGLSGCHSMCRITAKCNQPISVKLDLMIGITIKRTV